MKCDNCKKNKQILFGFYGQSLCLPCKREKEDNLVLRTEMLNEPLYKEVRYYANGKQEYIRR